MQVVTIMKTQGGMLIGKPSTISMAGLKPIRYTTRSTPLE